MFLKDYYGKPVTDPRYRDSDSYELPLGIRPYDDEAEGEEQNWTLSTSLLLTVEDGRITALEPGAAVTCPGDSGLGEIDPADYWEKQDDLAARAILDRITA